MNVTDQFHCFSGNVIRRHEPHPENYHIHDMAHALSMMPRFAGHTFWPYPINEHQTHVSETLERDYQELGPVVWMQGHVHDGTEGILTDVIAPLKVLLPDYRGIERQHEKAMARQLNLPFPFHPAVKEVDVRMCVTEALQLLPNPDVDYWTKRAAPFDHITLPDPRFTRNVFEIDDDGNVVTLPLHSDYGFIRDVYLKRFLYLAARIRDEAPQHYPGEDNVNRAVHMIATYGNGRVPLRAIPKPLPIVAFLSAVQAIARHSKSALAAE